jgi:hypothetical protein
MPLSKILTAAGSTRNRLSGGGMDASMFSPPHHRVD